MPVDDFAASLLSRSDAELAALEKDSSLADDAWAAVAAERARRAAASPAASPSRAAPPASRPVAPSGGAAAAPADDPRLARALDQLRAVLVAGETLDAWAVQRRLFALLHRRVIVAATSGRFVSLSRGLFGGYALADIRWQDLRDAGMRAGIFGSDLTVASLDGGDLASGEGISGRRTYAGLRTEQTQAVYRLCQAREQAWREKRRVRDHDELRARSGGIQLGGAGAAGGSTSASAHEPPVERLRRAKEMLDGGLISDAEYESIKAKVVDGL
jgi:hypothetical protein